MSRLDTKNIVDFVDRMPGFSPSALKIISLSNNLGSTPGDLVNAISMDPMLMAKLLRLVNSAYFGQGRSTVSLNRAVILLGFNTIKNIALSLAVVSAIKVRDDFKWFTNDQFWEHSVGCAVAARSLARALSVNPLVVEEFFVAGLLHDIGRAALIQFAQVECQKIYDPEYEPLVFRYQLEKNILGVTHAEIGGLITRRWKFPENMAACIEHHHTPMDAPPDVLKMALAVHIADITCHQLKIGIQTSANIGNISKDELAVIGLTKAEVINALQGTPEAVESAKEFLREKGR